MWQKFFLIKNVALFPTTTSTDVRTIPHLTNAPNIRTFYSIAYILNWTSYQKYQCIVPMYFYCSIQLRLLILPISSYFVVFCSMTYTHKKCCKEKTIGQMMFLPCRRRQNRREGERKDENSCILHKFFRKI